MTFLAMMDLSRLSDGTGDWADAADAETATAQITAARRNDRRAPRPANKWAPINNTVVCCCGKTEIADPKLSRPTRKAAPEGVKSSPTRARSFPSVAGRK